MSHKSEVKVNLTDVDYLKQALDKLGFKYTEAKQGEKLKTEGHYNVREEVDIRIESNGSKNYDGAIGFKKNEDGTFTAVGDFYELRTEAGEYLSSELMRNEVTASAKQAEINERLMRLDFNQLECQENKEEIVMTFERWTN